MGFPNFSGKHGHDAMFSAKDYLTHLEEHGGDLSFEMPRSIIITYQKDFFAHLKTIYGAEMLTPMWSGGLHRIPGTDVGFVGGFGIGAPVAVTVLEELITLGARKFLSIGTAGTLQKDMETGSILVVDRSIRDEGTSHHYLPQGKYAHADQALTGTIVEALKRKGLAYYRGTSWTTDAPYRETVEEARAYQSEGVLCVEMELSALFAAAEVRKASIGAIVVVSDSLAELEWRPRMRSPETADSLHALSEVALEILK